MMFQKNLCSFPFPPFHSNQTNVGEATPIQTHIYILPTFFLHKLI